MHLKMLLKSECHGGAIQQEMKNIARYVIGLKTENPTEEEIQKWSDIFENHRKALCKSTKPKTRNQIIKWLKNPHSDSAEYTMWGNGVALPCVFYVLNGIAYYAELTNSVT